jgi:hypothetical protein
MENLYLIRLFNNNESFFKIGTSVHKYCRFYEIMKAGYEVEITYMVLHLNCYDAWYLEKHLQSIFPKYYPLVKFGGYTECVKSIDLDKYKYIIQQKVGIPKTIIEKLPITWH